MSRRRWPADLVDRVTVGNRPRVAIFDDQGGRWGPLTDLRSICDIRSGALSGRERIAHMLGGALPGGDWRGPAAPGRAQPDEPLLLINSRWPAVRGVSHVRSLAPGRALLQGDGQIVAARVTARHAERLMHGAGLDDGVDEQRVEQRLLLERPWDLILALEESLRHDLAGCSLPLWTASAKGVFVCGEREVRVAGSARLHPMVVLNAESGPIAIDAQAIVGSGAVLAGPCYIGPGSVVAAHAHIRAVTVIGPRCVVGGEIAHSVLDGWSNKAHAGFLGHSLVGRWSNLGADTTVSNLKNTYGSIRVCLEAGDEPEDTGAAKLGALVADYVRTGIGTRLCAGSCVGTGSMIALSGLAPKRVGRFRWLTDAADVPCDPDRFLETARRMMARRGRDLTDARAAHLRALAEAGLAGDLVRASWGHCRPRC